MINYNDGHYTDPETQRIYEGVSGGISWPGAFPGVAVVLGTQARYPRGSGSYDIKWLHEFEEPDFDLFLAKMLEATRTFLVGAWYAASPSELEMDAVAELNQNSDVRLSLKRAPYADDPRRLYAYGVILKRRLDPADPSLFMNGTAFPKPSLDLHELLTADPGDHPSLTALGSVVAALETFQLPEDQEWLTKLDHDRNKLDPFS